ncbi:putative disease resistance RPP13-like protein 2 [Dichanthelium oligosanthes]|uniref:Putative disease resistance RPP13-like protein 2 n=1 Tax=Dichanthelium oligosanthes TaxID=888268 RepID=A0A1E5VZ98_9POAL|nr:putative disease resistance RPP13-like protein 2 [Dichanthelium oligosanthes]
MAEAIVGPLLGKLQDVVLSEAKALAGVSNDIYILRDKLMWLQAFVREAHLRSRHDGSELARVLACQMREVANEAEDAVDQFCLHLDRSSPGGGCGWVAGAPVIGRRLRIRYCLARRVVAMNARLEEIIRNSTMCCRLDGAPVAVADDAPKPWRSSRATLSGGQDWDASELCRLVGRADERNELEKMLLDQNTPERHLICVLGESGVGKTALVKDAYFDVAIRNNFVVCVWARFPPDTGDSIILQLIYERLVLDCSMLYHHELQEIAGQHKPYTAYKDKLSVFLQDHRYMVVIDSPISTTKWNKIRPKLPQGANGSKIVLITTLRCAYDRSDRIEVNRLDSRTSEDLFYSQAGTKRSTHTGTLIDIHGNVKEFTRGLPLAILLLARLLKTMEYDQWDRVFSYIVTSNKQADRFMTILSLSFDDLSDELKSCLLYLAGFPANTLINSGELVHLWMAECFLSQNKGMEMEELGQQYLKELISRGLIQLIKKGVHGDVELVAVHDHVQSFLRLEAQNTSFMHVHYACNGALVPANVRRLSLQNCNDKFSAFTTRLGMLRSVLSHFKEDYAQEVYTKKSMVNNCRQNRQGTSGEPLEKSASRLDMLQLLQGSPFLRVINLEGYDVGEQLPKKIGTMLHLHYLGIRCRSLTKIPASIGNLINLETIDIRGTGIRKLPESFWNIRTLRHVLGDELCFPKSAGALKLLQTLGTMSAEHASDQFGDILKKMIHLRSLDVTGINIRNNQSLKVAIQELAFLVSLSLCGEAIEMDFTCTSLDQLESLELNGKLVLLPIDHNIHDLERNMFLLNLSHLVLKLTHVNQAHINEFGRLPVLIRLMLFTGSYDGDELVFLPNSFTSLTLLRICRLINLKKIVVQDKSTMPRLDRFQIVGMPETSKLVIEALGNPTFDEKIKRYASKYEEY